MRATNRSIRLTAFVAAALITSGCTTDPEFWNAVATGLDEAAYDIAQENAGCYWAPPPGVLGGANRRYCPGDYGYRDIGPLPASYYRDRYRDDRGRSGGGHRDRDAERGDRNGRGGGKGGKR